MRPNSKQIERPQLPSTTGRDELNLAEFPISTLSGRVADDCKAISFQDEIRDQATGEVISRKLTITGDVEYGLPNPQDDDVIVALMHISKQANNFDSRIVPFSRMAVVELLGWARNGQSLRRLDESLNRWLGVTLRYENAWWDKTAKTWVNESFHILDNLTIYDQQTVRRIKRNTDQTSLPLSTFAWNEVIFRSFQAANIKQLDISLYFKLTLAASKRAYRFLDKRFYRDKTLKFDLRTFACEKIGFSPDYSAAKIKEKLQPTLEELETFGFLAPLSREQRYEKVSHGEWKIVLVRGQAATNTDAQTSLELPEPLPLVSELINRGISAKSAAELVKQHPAETIQAKIDVFDWLVEKQDKRVAKSPEGYLVKSICDDYKPVTGFIPAAQRKQHAEAQQTKARQAAETRRQEREKEAIERDKNQKLDAYWESLTPEEQAATDAKALADAKPEERTGAFARYFKDIHRRNYIEKLLRAEEQLPDEA